jgi:hypothetical protein
VKTKCEHCGNAQEINENFTENNNEQFNYNDNNQFKFNMRNTFPKKDGNLETSKRKKPFIEREGDWVCINCKNLNFSFRLSCNRCQLPKPEPEKTNSTCSNKSKINNNLNSNKLMDKKNSKTKHPSLGFGKNKYENFNTKKFKDE